MKIQEIKFSNKDKNYSILIGTNILSILPKKIKSICPKTKKIALIFDKGLPIKYRNTISKMLKNYDLTILNYLPSEKTKSQKSVDFFLNKLLSKILIDQI